MITIQLPNIAIQKVTNGYVVQWQKKNPVEKQSPATISVAAVCAEREQLLAVIEQAADDIAAIT